VTPDDPRHGRYAGYKQHRYDGEDACEPCSYAAARYEKGRRWDKMSGRPRLCSAVGLRRRVQALMRLGWTQRHIADVSGVHTRVLSHLSYGDPDRNVFRPTAVGVVRAYDTLSMQLGPSRHTRGRAERAGWPPPLAWDDDTIDDPATKPHGRHRDTTQHDPVAVDRVLHGGEHLGLTKSERWEVIRRWSGSDYALQRMHPSWNVARDRSEMRAAEQKEGGLDAVG
jgi:hypothetical protein